MSVIWGEYFFCFIICDLWVFIHGPCTRLGVVFSSRRLEDFFSGTITPLVSIGVYLRSGQHMTLEGT